MTNQINDGGPAFPTQATATTTRTDTVQPVQTHYGSTPGMTLRDYFAAAETLDEEHLTIDGAVALAGPKPEGDWKTNTIEWYKWEAKWRAELRFIRADAMLKAREAKP